MDAHTAHTAGVAHTAGAGATLPCRSLSGGGRGVKGKRDSRSLVRRFNDARRAEMCGHPHPRWWADNEKDRDNPEYWCALGTPWCRKDHPDYELAWSFGGIRLIEPELDHVWQPSGSCTLVINSTTDSPATTVVSMGRAQGQLAKISHSSPRRARPAEEPYGTLSARWLAQHIARSGPYAYHLLRRAHLQQVLSEGLLPWDERAGAAHNQADMMAPRPGHVYIGLDISDLWG